MATVQRVTSAGEARALAEHLLGRSRTLPAVVVTAGSGDGDGLISAQTVADDVGELAEVWWMPTGDATWEFKAAMPDLTQVFGDSARVYDLDDEWKINAYASTLYICGTTDRARQIEEELVADAMEAAAKAGLLAAKVAKARVVTGEVKGFPTVGRAMVRGDFGFATIRSELVPGGVAVERLLTVGMKVSGRLDERDHLLDISGLVRPADAALADYAVGDVVLVRVKTVGRTVVAVELYPGKVVEIRVTQVTGDADDDLRDLMSVGEVVTVRIDRVGAWLLSMVDVDEALALSTCSLIAGGPPWLEAAPVTEEEPDADEEVPPVVEEAAAPELVGHQPAPSGAVVPVPNPRQMSATNEAYERERRTSESLRAEIAQLSRSMEHLDVEVVRSRRTIEHLKTRQRELLKKARKAGPSESSRNDSAFASPEQQLRHDVYLAWVARIPAGEKQHRALPDEWLVGEAFCDSLTQMRSEVRDKVPDVIVEILLGIADRSGGREMHPLRAGDSGDAPPMTRPDGAVCWRVAVQRNSPSAARLHFWRRPGSLVELSRVELSRVVLHDDMKP